jgi:hypothetical protein
MSGAVPEMFRCPLAAQREAGVLLRSQFSSSEILLLYKLGETAWQRKHAASSTPVLQRAHLQVYLQANHLIHTRAPELLAKMIGLVKGADANNPCWHTWQPSFTPRVVEYHKYIAGGGLTKKHHFDEGSCFTMVIMLSAQDEFQGGGFKTWEADETWCYHDLRQGDCLIIPSYKFHSVDTLTGGRRNVIIMEIWDGAEGCEDARPMPPELAKRGDALEFEDDYTA